MRSLPRALVPITLLVAAASLAGRAEAQAVPAGNAGPGRVLFQQNCALCHWTGQRGAPMAVVGPVFAGVIGRPAASVPNFTYTKALQASHLTWDTAPLNQFLAGPGALVPGTAMPIPVANPADRVDLIAFLGTL